MISKIPLLPKTTKTILIYISDYVIAFLAGVIAIQLVFPDAVKPSLLLILGFSSLLYLVILRATGFYKELIRSIDEKIFVSVSIAAFLNAVLLKLVLVVFSFGFPSISFAFYFFFTAFFTVVSRFYARKLSHQSLLLGQAQNRIAIYGAGEAGIQIAESLKKNKSFRPMFFVDDNPELWGRKVSGLPVFQSQEIQEKLAEFECKEVVVSIPSLSYTRRREIVSKLAELGVQTKILPGLDELLTDKVTVSNIRDVGIEDILGREVIPPHQELIEKSVLNKVVLVSGAGGSIGSEISRQVCAQGPRKIILLDNSEFNLYSIDKELRIKFPKTEIMTVLSDVCDFTSLNEIVKSQKVETFYHAAAYKHVPIVEDNVISGLTNNVQGTLSAVQSCIQNKVERFVLISTDKAVRPTNIMGATKRIAELVVKGVSASAASTKVTIVRFGNVLGSSGSVVPLFKEQIQKGGPITITHPEVTRFFMTISEAAQLVIQAGSMGTGGEVFVLDMGQPVKIVDLAQKMIKLSGLSLENKDIEIQFVGLRPGEKLYEELLIGENVKSTPHPRIMMAHEYKYDESETQVMLQEFRKLDRGCDPQLGREFVKKWVKEYQPKPQS